MQGVVQMTAQLIILGENFLYNTFQSSYVKS
jgi:hypothetical protein